jgi:WD40 repeat protein
MEINRQAELAERLAVSPKNNFILVGSMRHASALWDITTGQKLKSLKPSSGIRAYAAGVGVRFMPDGTKAVTYDNRITLWDIETGRELKAFPMAAGDMAITPDGRRALMIGPVSNTDLSLLDLKTGKVKKLKGHADSGWRGALYTVDISPDGKFGLTASFDSTVRVWDIENGEELRRFIGHQGTFRQGMVNSARFSPDGRSVISAGSDKTVRLWDAASGKLMRTFTGHTDAVKLAAFSHDGRLAISGDCDAVVIVWDVATGHIVRTFKGHSEGYTSFAGALGINGVGFTPDDRHALSAGDASVRVWDIASGREVAMMINFDDGEWLTITPDGYYNSSPNGHKYMNLLLNKTSYNMEQFYDVFYRPDIVAAKLRGEDIGGLVTITMKEAIKNPPPVVEFTSKTTDTNQPSVKVCYQVKSAGGGIGEVRLFHNGKLIKSDGYYKEIARSTASKTQLAILNSKAIYEDMRSVSVKGKSDTIPMFTKPKGDLFEECDKIDAIPGENEVSIAAFNGSNTVQSYMKTIHFNSRAKSEDPHLYIFAIGIDQYRDNTVNLKYALKDAKDLEAKLKAQSATLYKLQNIHYALLTDKEATKTNITAKINELSRIIKPQDSFILFVAGHGVLLQNQYYMLTHDFSGGVSDDSMISSNEIVEMSKKIKSLSQLFIFDTCHAGGVDTIVSGLYDARMSVLAKKMGLHIYASASDKQTAMDGYKGNGLFTYTLLDGLNNNRAADKNKDGKVSVVGLGSYSKERTTNISKEIGHAQTPLIINFGKDYPIYQLR